MENQNICKFNISRASDLVCTGFIFETAAAQAKLQTAQHHMLGLVTAGTGILTVEGHSHDLETGVLFLVPRHTLFSVTEGRELQYFYIPFYGRRGEEYMRRLSVSNEGCVFSGLSNLIPFWHNSQQLAEDGNIDMVCEAVLLYSLAHMRPGRAGASDLLSRITSITQERFTDPDLTVSDIAARLGYDPKYLSAFFKKKKGISYTRYLREMRIRHAVFLMEEGLVSVKNIALLSGFRDPLYFSKVFTETEGISPKNYISDLNSKTPAP